MKYKKFVFYIEITKKCNLKCPFCPSANNQRNDVMEFQKFTKIANNIKEYAELVYLHVLGEPLLHPEIEKILEYCESSNINLGLTTNGLFINQKGKLLLSLNNLSKINISLQCLIQFDEIRRKKYLENLMQFLEYHNQIGSLIPINLRLWNNKDDLQNSSLNCLVIDTLASYVNHNNIRFSIDDEFEWPSEEKKINFNETNCLGGKRQFSVLTNGNIGLCCLDYLGNTKLGNLLKNDFNEILESELYHCAINGFNERKPFFSLCQKCTFRNKFIKK